jgi:hypothetical protein
MLSTEKWMAVLGFLHGSWLMASLEQRRLTIKTRLDSR